MKQGYKHAELHYKVRTLHWQDVIDVSKHHWVMDFHEDAPHIPLVGAKMSLCDISIFWGYFSYKKRVSFVYTGKIEFDYHSYTLMCPR